MSGNTYVAGQKLRASKIAYQKVWEVFDTVATSSFGTTETVVATAPSTTYAANSAYMIRFNGLLRIATAAGDIGLAIHDTNASGTSRRTIGYVSCASTTRNYDCDWEHLVANTSTTTDITSRVLVLTAAASANTGIINAAAARPYIFTCYYVGVATDFPEAVAL